MENVKVLDSATTARILDYRALVDALESASRELDQGRIHVPVRVSVPLGRDGQFLTMPASATDIAIHKLVSVNFDNLQKGLPTIFSLVTVCDGETGEPQFILDGQTLTGRRTAALSMLGVRLLHPATPRSFVIVGTGVQARYHAEAIVALYPEACVHVKGSDSASEVAFRDALKRNGIDVFPAEGHVPADADTVITVTTSKKPVYDEEARAGRLVIGAGSSTPDAAELAPRTVRGSLVFVDNLPGTRAEAGDLLQADVDWTKVTSLGSVDATRIPKGTPILMKAVGCGAWDLAACRVARDALSRQ
ncbi:ornithine cyclodeaminase [Burkholderia sp. YI23]|nr:ornithine cyclodeaminase [Burkholderia sp. YI23]